MNITFINIICFSISKFNIIITFHFINQFCSENKKINFYNLTHFDQLFPKRIMVDIFEQIYSLFFSEIIVSFAPYVDKASKLCNVSNIIRNQLLPPTAIIVTKHTAMKVNYDSIWRHPIWVEEYLHDQLTWTNRSSVKLRTKISLNMRKF